MQCPKKLNAHLARDDALLNGVAVALQIIFRELQKTTVKKVKKK